MAVAYGSVSSQGTTRTPPLVITKPSGLAAGDLMIAQCLVNGDASTTFSLTGWTQIQHVSGTNDGMTILAKIADSSDAAASNFSFSQANTGGDDGHAGYIYRFTGTFSGTVAEHILDSSGAYGTDGTTGKSTTSLSINSLPNCMFAIFAGAFGSSEGANEFSTYAMATNNPTWTELIDVKYSDLSNINIGMAYATRSASTDTGTLSYAESLTTTDRLGIVALAIQEDTNASTTLDLVSLQATTYDPASVIGSAAVTTDLISLQATTYDPTGTGGTNKFTNTTKNAATNVTNQTKN